MDALQEKAIAALDRRIEQMQERTDQLRALRDECAQHPTITHNDFSRIAKETGAYGYQDYSDQWTPIKDLWEWLDANTYARAVAEDEEVPA